MNLASKATSINRGRWPPSRKAIPHPIASGQRLASLLLIGPALAVIVMFFLLPIGASFLLSLTDFDKYVLADLDNLRWRGLANYDELLHSPLFWQALRNTVVFTCIAGPLTMALALTAALMLTARSALLPGVVRTIYFAPVVTTVVAVAVVWRFLCHTRYGLFNQGLRLAGLEGVDWLGNPTWAMLAIILLVAWKNFGYSMVIFIAGLQNIPVELYEAATMDGAGWWHRLRYITLPSLAPTFVFVGVITVVGYLQLFSEPYVMTRGGPLHGTYSLVMLMYEEGFRWWNLGHAAAAALLLFLLVFGVAASQAVLRRGVTP